MPSSPFTRAAQYSLDRADALKVFLEDPAVAMDTNHLEREIRPIALGRKNWLFCCVPQARRARSDSRPRSLVRSCRRDDGRSVEVGCQEQASNHPKRLASRALVVSVGEKSNRIRQVRIRKTNASEPLMTRREPERGIRTGGEQNSRDKLGGCPEGCPGGVRRAGGVILIQALLRNCGNQSP